MRKILACLLLCSLCVPARAAFSHDGPVHDGHEVQIDLPAEILKHNIASRGLGCCVFRSLDYCGLWQNVPELRDLPEQMVKAGIAGGGWPEKVDQIMQKFAPNVEYVQIKGDWDLIRLALQTGRCVAITYGSAHMVCLVSLSDGVGCFRDNNFVGPNELIWGNEREVIAKAGGSQVWAVVLLNPRPPAPPHGRQTSAARLAPVGPAWLAAPGAPGRYQWRGWPDELDQWALWRDGRQVGVFTAAEDFYREYIDRDRWGKDYRRPPVELPPAALARLETRVPDGVLTEFLQAGPRYSHCGTPITRDECASTLTDDAAKLSLTLIGAESDRARALAELPAAFRARVLVQSYAPDNWAVKSYGFVTTGAPTIYLQTPDGSVLARVDQYAGPQTWEKLRKADPSYQPEQDPDPTRPPPSPLLSSERALPADSLLGLLAAGALGGCGFVLLRKG